MCTLRSRGRPTSQGCGLRRSAPFGPDRGARCRKCPPDGRRPAGEPSQPEGSRTMKCRAKRVHALCSRGSFTRLVHPLRNVVHALRSLDFATFTPFVHAFIDPFTRTVHAFGAPFTRGAHPFTRGAHPFTQTATPVRRTGRVSVIGSPGAAASTYLRHDLLHATRSETDDGGNLPRAEAVLEETRHIQARQLATLGHCRIRFTWMRDHAEGRSR